MPKILYATTMSPFLFERMPAGGHISHAKGAIDGMRKNGLTVDVVADSKIPGLPEAKDLKYIWYAWQSFRRQISNRSRRRLFLFLIRLYLNDRRLFRWAMKQTIGKLLAQGNYVAVYMRASRFALPAAELAVHYETPLILEVNTPLSMSAYNNKGAEIQWPQTKAQVHVPDVEYRLYNAASVISVDSSIRAQWIKEMVDSRYAEKMVINRSCVDSEFFKPRNNSDNIRYDLSIPSDTVVVGMASSFLWYNDIEELKSIIEDTCKNRPFVRFLLVMGRQDRAHMVKQHIRKAGLDDLVVFLEQVFFDEMPKVYEGCDILISHLNYHGGWPHNCSMKHLEYMAMGKPVVATDIGEVNFAIEHDINGFLVNEGDVNTFVNSIVCLVDNPELRRQFGKRSRELAVSKYQWEFNARNFLEPVLNDDFKSN